MTKRNKIIYWVSTVWLSFGMTSGGIFQMMKMEDAVKNFQHLGYPEYYTYHPWRVEALGVIAILIPKYALIKEWAYAGFFFVYVWRFCFTHHHERFIWRHISFRFDHDFGCSFVVFQA